MKRYYIEEDDNGKEVKRKLTTFENDNLTELTNEEIETLYYEASAQFLSKAMHFRKIEMEFFSRGVVVSEELLEQVGNNIIEGINEVEDV